MARVYIGQIIHTRSLNDFEILTNGFVAVYADGRIAGIGDNYELWRDENSQFVTDATEVQLSTDQFLMPGLVDCHIHAPQVAQIGLGLDKPLLEWLNTYTFPLEASFTDTNLAGKVYKNVVETTIKNGTTLASYFGTNSKDSTIILAKEALARGQRALVGKVCSNCNSPDFYVETTDESIKSTNEFVAEILKWNSSLVKPIITPRFALSCTKELMLELATIARKHDLHIQTHISESVAEVEFVKSLFSTSYAQAYDNAGLLTKKTVLAHGVHLADEELTLIKEKGSSIAHCPSSNTMLSSGFCDVWRLIDNGIKVGLGTDVSGGNSISIKEAILRALDVTRHLEFVKKHDIKGSSNRQQLNANSAAYTPLNYKQAIYLATLGGAEALALDTITGNFVVGKEFDALLIDTSLYPLHNYGAYNAEADNNKNAETRLLEKVQKFIYVGDDRNIVKVFVAGKQIN